MTLDIIFVVIMAMAVFKGLRHGLIYAVFSFIGLVAGLAAALKLSGVVASWISDEPSPSRWLPVISFFIVFIAVAMIVRFAGNFIQKAFETVLLGWFNRLSGAALYMLLYAIIFSVILFYVMQLRLVSRETMTDSYFFPYLQPLGPWVIDGLGKVIPLFRDMFDSLQEFFGEVSGKMAYFNLRHSVN